MIKMLLLAAVVVGALIIGGVLEVKVHTDALGQVPGRVLSFATNPGNQEKVRATATQLKRRGEQFIIKDEEKQTKLALLYVKQDAERLQELLDAGQAQGSDILPQAELLSDSMERVQERLENASAETVTQLKSDARESLNLAQLSLKELKTQQKTFETLQERFAQVTSSLEANLQAVGINTNKSSAPASDVAGIQDPLPSPTPESPAIKPLNF